MVRAYIRLSGIFFLSVGFLKLLYVMKTSDQRIGVDALLGIDNRLLLSGVAVLELVVGFCGLFLKPSNVTLLSLTWLSGSILTYRLALNFMGYDRECSCLGSLVTALGWSRVKVNDYLLITLISLICFGIASILVSLARRSSSGSA